MNTINLNLTRKWRSKNFDQIVGQELSIKMLKNSLYLGQFFPVYLFSGQRGCGKTSTARVFAAAVNCQELATFQKNPKQVSVPCLTCASCKAMMQGQHPDFFEIDAASHTGVDTIRQIIDASQLLPIMGEKKIYLIDEAHMLSKASFNALLKILEEPPRSVLFILATTDDQKIIDTVKSRCFQLFFRPIESSSLLNHLIAVCQAEQIAADTQGLSLIIQESEGSARDAINLLEQVRFSSGKVNKEAVLRVLGHLDDETVLKLFETAVTKRPTDLLHFLQNIDIERYSADFIWQRCIVLVRAALWMKHGVKPKNTIQNMDALQKLSQSCSWAVLNNFLELLYANEAVFAKTTSKHALLEMILLQLSHKNKTNDDATGMPTISASPSSDEHDYVAEDDEFESDDESEEEDDQDSVAASWKIFLNKVDGLNDPLLRSVFRQGTVIGLDPKSGCLDVTFSKELSFFKDWLEESVKSWMPLLKESFSATITINPQFNGQQTKPVAKVAQGAPVASASKAQQPKERVDVKPARAAAPQQRAQSYSAQRAYAPKASIKKQMDPILDVSDVALWPKANLLLRYFPGSISEIKEVSHETN